MIILVLVWQKSIYFWQRWAEEQNDFHIFVSSDLDLDLQLCSPSYHCPTLFSRNYKFVLFFRFETIGCTGRTDGRAATLNPSIEGRVITHHSLYSQHWLYFEHLTYSDQISSPSQSCCSHIRELRCKLPWFYNSHYTIAACVHYCNSLEYSRPTISRRSLR